VTIRRLVGAALTVPVLIGGLLLVTARPAAACSCAVMSEAKKAAYADAIFVGTLIDRRIGEPTGAVTSSTDMAVWTFEVSRVYKGTVSERQEIATAMSGASCGLELSGPGPFLVFARRPGDAVAKSWWGDRQLDPGQYVSHLCLGSRALSDGGEPTIGGLPPSSPAPVPSPAPAPPPSPAPASSPAPAGVAIGVGALAAVVAAALGLAALKARRRADAD
jgi:hypothetical protein